MGHQAHRVFKLLHVVGTRPNFMKVAPVMQAADAWNCAPDGAVKFEQTLIHTGQHYDDLLSDIFFRQLDLPEPAEYLGVGSGSHGRQTARLLEALEPVLSSLEPDAVLVPGNVNSTLAGALASAKLNIPVIHLEAGLRSGDRTMPEEINRIVVDHLADLLLTSCPEAEENLAREGITGDRVASVGNTMIDSLERLRARALGTVSDTCRLLGLNDDSVALVTLHRPSNVDDPRQLGRLLGVLEQLAADVPVVFPMHPRTRERLAGAGMSDTCDGKLRITEPLGYLEFLGLMASRAQVVITDSGGLQEEASVLGVPCITVRTTTERPITVSMGANTLVDPHDEDAVLQAIGRALARGRVQPPPAIPLWDGKAAVRAVKAVAKWAVAGAQAQ